MMLRLQCPNVLMNLLIVCYSYLIMYNILYVLYSTWYYATMKLSTKCHKCVGISINQRDVGLPVC